MELKKQHFLVCVLTLFSILNLCTSDPSCVYTVYVETGSGYLSGTDSTIGATFYAASGTGISISNLAAWGGAANTEYFKTGNVDVFSGIGPCLGEPICGLNITSDGKGCSNPSWKVNSVELSVAGWGQPCRNLKFDINKWLAEFAYPYSLSAFVNLCNSVAVGGSGAGTAATVYVV